MRILIVYSYRGWGGVLSPVLKIGAGLAELGHDISVACHPGAQILPRVEADPLFHVVTAAIRAEANPLPAFQLARAARHLRPDLILCDRRKDVKFSVAARWLNGDFAIVHNHEAPSPLTDSVNHRFFWKRRVQTVIVNSHTLRDTMLAAAPWLEHMHVEVIHTGKDVAYYRPMTELRPRVRSALGIPMDAFVVSYHGNVQPRKNIDVLIRAIAALPTDIKVHALIIGQGPQLPEMREQAATLNLPITFTGVREDVPELLSAADVAVHLSSAEGFANSVTEAMACGLPVIASDATSHPEQIEHGAHGFLVPLRQWEGVAEAIGALASDPEKRLAMGRAARARVVTEFGWDRMLRRYDTVLREAVQRYRSGSTAR